MLAVNCVANPAPCLAKYVKFSMKALIPHKNDLKTAFQTFLLFSAFAKCEKKLEVFFLFVSKWNFLICQSLTKLFRTLFLKCHTESKTGCLNKMNTDMSSKATTNRRTWKFILRVGVSLEFSDREKFCDIFRTLGRSFGPNFGFPYMFYTFSILPLLKTGRSQAA